jgi:hypothetical protein
MLEYRKHDAELAEWNMQVQLRNQWRSLPGNKAGNKIDTIITA